jgi:hypothetical protein
MLGNGYSVKIILLVSISLPSAIREYKYIPAFGAETKNVKPAFQVIADLFCFK